MYIKVHLYKNSVSLNTECEITTPKYITPRKKINKRKAQNTSSDFT